MLGWREAVTMPWRRQIEGFTSTLRAAGLAPGTVKTYGSYLTSLACAHKHPDDVTEDSLMRWLGRPGWSQHARKSARTIACKFFAWAVRVGLRLTNPAAFLPTIRAPKGAPRPCPVEVYERALERASPREQLMLRLARYTGMRVSEVAAVHSSDLIGGVLYVRGKGDKVRRIPIIREDLIEAIRDASGFVFPSPHGGHLRARWLSKVLSNLLGRGWSAHSLRHMWATTALANGASIEAVSAVLGHSKLETTMIYAELPGGATLRAIQAAA